MNEIVQFKERIDGIRAFSTKSCSKKKHRPLAPDLNEPDSENRSLINPFRPEEFTIRITANRRRWIHVFPVDKMGRAKLAHHYVVGSSIVHVLQAVESANPVRSASVLNSPTKNVLVQNTDKVTGIGGGNRTVVWAWGSTGEVISTRCSFVDL